MRLFIAATTAALTTLAGAGLTVAHASGPVDPPVTINGLECVIGGRPVGNSPTDPITPPINTCNTCPSVTFSDTSPVPDQFRTLGACVPLPEPQIVPNVG